jgi:hypothetical protein
MNTKSEYQFLVVPGLFAQNRVALRSTQAPYYATLRLPVSRRKFLGTLEKLIFLLGMKQTAPDAPSEAPGASIRRQ